MVEGGKKMAGFAPEVLALLNSLGLAAPMGIGEKFFVNGGADGITAGVNAAGRGSKDRPFLTIAYALTQCVANRNDYIFCWNTYNQDTAPIVVTVPYVHIIGLNKPGIGTLILTDALAGDNPMFQCPVVGGGTSGVEIAGFCIGGGATHGCIEISAAYDWWIHHCTFGHEWAQAPQDGIRIVALSHCQALLIEDNIFLGASGPKGTITQYGIVAPAATAHVYQGVIRRNKILRCTTGGIALLNDCREVIVDENKISCASDAVAMAIDLGVTTSGCQISHNEAQHGDAVMAQNPYRDQAVADANDWMCNQVGSVMKYPDEAM